MIARIGNAASTAKQISPVWRSSLAAIAAVIRCSVAAGNSRRADGANRCLSQRINPSSPASGGATAPAHATTAAPAATAEATTATEAAATDESTAPAPAAVATPATVGGKAPAGIAGQPEQQAEDRCDTAEQQRRQQPRHASGRERRADAADAPRRNPEYAACDLGHDEGGEQGEQPTAAAVTLATRCGGHGFGQRLAVHRSGRLRCRAAEAPGEAACAEARPLVFHDAASRGRMRACAFRPVASLVPAPPVVLGPYQQHAVVDLLATGPP